MFILQNFREFSEIGEIIQYFIQFLRLWQKDQVVGVATGCLIGMTSLLFMDLEKVERLKKIEGMRSMFQTIVEDGHRVMECDRMTLYLVAQDEKEKYLLQYGIAKGGTIKDTIE